MAEGNKWTPRAPKKPTADDYAQRQLEHDYFYELGVSLGAARGNLTERTPEALFEEFDFMLRAKADPKFIKRFNEYFFARPKARSFIPLPDTVKITP